MRWWHRQPGLRPQHHLLFAAPRERSSPQRGSDYLEILQAGGGILSTVAATRAATEDQLLEHGRRWLGEMLAHGTTTIEAKSGYGLDLPSELRLLEVAHRLGKEGPIEVHPTWLGAHAVPPEFRARPDGTEATSGTCSRSSCLRGGAGSGEVRRCLLRARGLQPGQSRRCLREAAAWGSSRGSTRTSWPRAAAGSSPRSSVPCPDHLAVPSPAGIDALAAAAGTGHPVVAVLLPATTWFLMRDEVAPARTFIDRGVPVALATDFNPGTSPTASLPFVLTVACLTLKLTPSEALAAVTVNAAAALGIGDEVGSIESGRQADLAIWAVPTHRQIPYWPAADLIRAVVKRGRVVLEREAAS